MSTAGTENVEHKRDQDNDQDDQYLNGFGDSTASRGRIRDCDGDGYAPYAPCPGHVPELHRVAGRAIATLRMLGECNALYIQSIPGLGRGTVRLLYRIFRSNAQSVGARFRSCQQFNSTTLCVSRGSRSLLQPGFFRSSDSTGYRGHGYSNALDTR